MTGLFGEWQANYAAHGITTFPVGTNKRPLVRNYLVLGERASAQLALRFDRAEAIGFACRRNRITVLDIDSTNEKLLADGLARHGPSPFIVQTGSGNFQAWYRHSGERRRIRPNPAVPIDILGDGYVVAPPSRGARGQYRIIQGTLDDLDRLPPMRHEAQSEKLVQDIDRIPEGRRNDSLWRFAMQAARRCGGEITKLLEDTMTHNRSACYEPLPDAEVLRIVASAFKYEAEGRNWIGQGSRVVMAFDEVDNLAGTDPRAFALFAILRRHHDGADDFILAKSMAESIGWSVNTLKAARDALEGRGIIECVHRGGQKPNDPPVYRFKKGVRF